MLIRQKKSSDAASHEITPEHVYVNRRQFIEASGLIAGGLLASGMASPAAAALMPKEGKFQGVKEGYHKLGAKDKQTPFEAVTSYNNFYEFGLDKEDPAANAGAFKPLPWQVKVDGLCANPGTLNFDDFLKPHTLEDRVYRHRCVEAWSMVIPWVGIPLAELVKRFEPQGSAKYVAFETVMRPAEMPGQRNAQILPWPYVEGLRLDEAMNPLAMLAVGIYGVPLPNQNGAPLRLVTPWKYGFKGIKSIVRMTFTERQPKNTWNVSNGREYGFFANVNPKVDHPRWSQATERRIGDFFRRETLMFNGYEEEVGQLYAGMDLAKNY
ncbi:MAG: protein-methionine-sulfoxide reductase catalytic subunit MsrP [Rhodospirillaceae bacterium]|nr:protein-methionine-sulfoxide reductase catalytic subunit MsrP [Rhodospirillaceae bacterium]